jgi:hypothetical protein
MVALNGRQRSAIRAPRYYVRDTLIALQTDRHSFADRIPQPDGVVTAHKRQDFASRTPNRK